MSRILELNSGFGCNGEVGLLLLLFWVSVAKQRGSGAGATATKDEHEDNVVAATLVSGLFKCLARYFDVDEATPRAKIPSAPNPKHLQTGQYTPKRRGGNTSKQI